MLNNSYILSLLTLELWLFSVFRSSVAAFRPVTPGPQGMQPTTSWAGGGVTPPTPDNANNLMVCDDILPEE